MHDFEELEPTTQAAMLRHFAREVLASYPFPKKGLRIQIAARSFNTVLRVRADDGFDGALRLGPRERIHVEGTEEVEVAWMRSLAAAGIVAPPPVIATRMGVSLSTIRTPTWLGFECACCSIGCRDTLCAKA